MNRNVAILVCALLLLASTVAVAGSGSGKGRYATYTVSDRTTELPGGGSVSISHYHQFVFADDPTHPLDDTNADCVGQFILSGDEVVSASGVCYGNDAAGSGFSYWWRMDEGGTEECPDLCGSFGYFDGYGKYDGISGKGTWTRTTVTPQGGSGTWEGTYSIP